MFNIAYLISIIFIFILELIAKKKIISRNFLVFFIIIYLVILMGGSLENPDYVIYKNVYERDFFTKDIGFGILIIALKSLGVTYNLFRLIVAIIGIYLVHQTVKKFVINKTYFYLLYILYPFLFDIVQVRNFLAMSLLIYALPYLLEKEKKQLVKYVVLILIASTIQKVAIVYLPLLLLKNLNKKHYLKFLIIISIICSFIIGLNKSLILQFSNSILSTLSEDLTGLSNYLEVNTEFGWIIFWGEQIVNFLLVLWSKKIIINRLNNNTENKSYSPKIAEFSTLIYNINLFMFIFLPLFVLDENFTRIIRNVMPLNLMLYSIATSMLFSNKSITKPASNKKTINAILFISFILSYQVFLLTMLFSSYWDTIVIPVFNNNWIW